MKWYGREREREKEERNKISKSISNRFVSHTKKVKKILNLVQENPFKDFQWKEYTRRRHGLIRDVHSEDEAKKEDQEEHDSQFFTVFFVAVKNESTRAKKKSQVTWHMIKFSEESKASRNWRDWRGRQVKRDRRTWNTKKSLDLVLKTWLTFDSLPFYLHEMEK